MNKSGRNIKKEKVQKINKTHFDEEMVIPEDIFEKCENFIEIISAKVASKQKVERDLFYFRDYDNVHVHDMANIERIVTGLMLTVDALVENNVFVNEGDMDNLKASKNLLKTIIEAVNYLQKEKCTKVKF